MRPTGLILAALLLLAAPPAAAEDDDRAADRRMTHIARLYDLIDGLGAEIRRLEARLAEVAEIQDRALRPALVTDDGPAAMDRLAPPATEVLRSGVMGRPAARGLDMDRLAARCSDADGCLATLGLGGALAEGRPLEAAIMLGPCALHLDAGSGAWSVSAACAGGRPKGQWGRDGDAPRLGEDTRPARILIDLAGACLLAEAEPTHRRILDGAPSLGPDTTRGLVLIATAAEWPLTGAFPAELLPPGTRFDCRLTVRD